MDERIIELRQYLLRPGQRDVLIELFDREFVETQEQVGMAILGQFRDLDRPDHFVWLRGFHDMPGRAEALRRFYTGPAWKAHGRAAVATMIDSDDVLLLRPTSLDRGIPAARPPIGHTEPPASAMLVTLHFRDRPFDETFAKFFDEEVRVTLGELGATPIAGLQTEYAENTYPALPVRDGEHVFAWIARFPDVAALDEHRRRLERSQRWRELTLPGLLAEGVTGSQSLRLTPTARSRLR